MPTPAQKLHHQWQDHKDELRGASWNTFLTLNRLIGILLDHAASSEIHLYDEKHLAVGGRLLRYKRRSASTESSTKRHIYLYLCGKLVANLSIYLETIGCDATRKNAERSCRICGPGRASSASPYFSLRVLTLRNRQRGRNPGPSKELKSMGGIVCKNLSTRFSTHAADKFQYRRTISMNVRKRRI